MPPLVVRPEAQADLLHARDWYARQRAGLGEQFLLAVDEILEQVGATPEIFAQVLKHVRRAKVRRFPYIVYYPILDDRTEVLAVLHGSRDPRVWQQRA
jgi:plasmid stabilization system protein ParE